MHLSPSVWEKAIHNVMQEKNCLRDIQGGIWRYAEVSTPAFICSSNYLPYIYIYITKLKCELKYQYWPAVMEGQIWTKKRHKNKAELSATWSWIENVNMRFLFTLLVSGLSVLLLLIVSFHSLASGIAVPLRLMLLGVVKLHLIQPYFQYQYRSYKFGRQWASCLLFYLP